MTRSLHAVFDGVVLRPEEPVDLQPNKRYLVLIKQEDSAPTRPHPLEEIGALAVDMGVADLAERHDWYAHGKLEDDQFAAQS